MTAAMELLHPASCLLLFILFLLTRPGVTSADNNGPVKVKVKEEDDVVLPCSLRQTNLNYQIFDWTKVKDDEDKTQNVFLYDGGIHYNNGRPGQDPQFKGRVSHFKDELQHGNASIEIRNTKLEDSGNYKCIFPNIGNQSKSFHIELVVGAAPEPSLTTVDETADRALLQCSVKGAFPEPTVEWRNSAGEVLHSVVTLNSEVNERFDITLQTNVTQTGFYNCVVTQYDIGHQVYSVTFERFGAVKVKEGSDVVLRCSLGQTDLTNQVFDWKKDGQEVFYYNASTGGGQEGQDPKFKGRISYFEDELKHGNASIKIRNTKWEDRGDYSCEFPNLQNQIFPIELAVDPDFEKRNIEGDSTGLIAGLIVVLCFVVIVAAGIIYLLFIKNRKLKHSLQERNEGRHPPSEFNPLQSN